MLPLKYFDMIERGSLTPSRALITGCLHPRRIWARDQMTLTNVPIDVNCRKCVNCTYDLQQQWVTRMCLHSINPESGKQYNHHCYYITLTYAPFDHTYYKKHPYRADWLQTLPVLDKNNSSHKESWTPSVLVQSHLQKFLKRLRALHPDYVISYAACGELGDTWGRPHFHLILWSKYKEHPLTKTDIERAWSLKIVHTKNPRIVKRWTYKAKDSNGDPIAPGYFQFGRVDFDDLVASGDFNYLSQQTPADSNNARKCFKYVATYVQKKAVTNQYAIKRMYRAFKTYPMNVVPRPTMFRGPVIGQYGQHFKTDIIDLVDDTPNRMYWDTDDDVFRIVIHNKKNYEKCTFKQFLQLFGNFFVVSRQISLGKDYAIENLDRFKEKNFTLPRLWGKSLVFPNYYSRLLDMAEVPIRLRKHSALSCSLVKGAFPSLFEYYSCLLRSRDYYAFVRSRCSSSSPFDIFDDDRQPTATRGEHPNGDGFLYDVTIQSPFRSVAYHYSSSLDIFEGYVFDRSIKDYVLVDCMDRISFCEFVLDILLTRRHKYEQSLPNRKKRLALYDTIYNAHDENMSEVDQYLTIRQQHKENYKLLRTHESRIDGQ